MAVQSATLAPRFEAARRAHRSSRELALLGGLVAAGLVIRLWIGFTNYGWRYDVDSAYIVAHWLTWHPLHVYSSLRYPYPGGFLPVIYVMRELADATGIAFSSLWKVPSILADAGIAVAVWWGLWRSGAGPVARMTGAALVALGPSFILISGYHGQIDASAILPALIAVLVWAYGGAGRGWQAGLLVGLAGAVKTVPLFIVLAMLPSARSRREAAVLVACAAAVPLLSVVPFLAANWHVTRHALTENRGVPGMGGLSLLVEPKLAHFWQTANFSFFRPSSIVVWLFREQNLIVGVAALLAGAYVWFRRLEVIPAAALIWLVIYVANPDWAFQYFVWGLPFFLLAGRFVEVAGLQVLLLLPAAEVYFHFGLPGLRNVYAPLMDAVWLALLIATLVVLGRTRPGTLWSSR